VPITEDPSPDGLRATNPVFQSAVEAKLVSELQRRDLRSVRLDPNDRTGWLEGVEREVLGRIGPSQLPLL
jgi:hypothetical protein